MARWDVGRADVQGDGAWVTGNSSSIAAPDRGEAQQLQQFVEDDPVADASAVAAERMVRVELRPLGMHMGAAVTQLREDGFDVSDEDVARLSPFGRHHINMLGRYSFQLPELPRGLRPLRDPDAADKE